MENEKACTQCLATKPTSEFYRNGPRPASACKPCTIKKRLEYKRANRGKVRVWARKYREKYGKALNVKGLECQRRMKAEFIAEYGGRCSCCGESEASFLTLEHTKRDGKRHRDALKTRSTYRQLVDLKRRGWPKDGYTVFCMNCNMATKDGKPCPHQMKLKFVVVGW